jgi:predicted DNA-binding transcriptional regulator YafY
VETRTALPVLESDDPVTSRLLLAMREGRAVEIVYYGLNETGVRRRICPGTIFTVEGFLGTYVSGFCFLRKQERTFCCERMLLA